MTHHRDELGNRRHVRRVPIEEHEREPRRLLLRFPGVLRHISYLAEKSRFILIRKLPECLRWTRQQRTTMIGSFTLTESSTHVLLPVLHKLVNQAGVILERCDLRGRAGGDA